MIDRLLVSFLGWVAGVDNTPGVAQRNTARVKGLFYLLVLGLIAPFATIILGLLASWITGSVGFARTIMAFGILPGAILATILGFGFALVVDLLVRVLGNTPEDAGVFVETYSAFLVWVLIAGELCWLLLPYAPLWAIFLGVMVAFIIIHMVVGWNLPVDWSRTLAFRFQIVLLLLVIGVSVSNLYHTEYFYTRAEKEVVEYAGAVEIEREKARRTADLAKITARIAAPKSDAEYRKAKADLRRWEDEGYPKPVRYARQGWRAVME